VQPRRLALDVRAEHLGVALLALHRARAQLGGGGQRGEHGARGGEHLLARDPRRAAQVRHSLEGVVLVLLRVLAVHADGDGADHAEGKHFLAFVILQNAHASCFEWLDGLIEFQR
jgi:hypothetical protein